MKSIYITFEDGEFIRLTKLKDSYTWKDLILDGAVAIHELKRLKEINKYGTGKRRL